MKKFLSLFSILLIVILTSCTTPKRHTLLMKEDIKPLSDKKFYLVAVNVYHNSNKEFFQKSVGVDNLKLKNETLRALPIDKILKILSDELEIVIDSSDFKKADLNAMGDKWSSNKSNVNLIIVNCTLIEKSGVGLSIGSSYLGMDCTINVKTAKGYYRFVGFKFPIEANMYFNVFKIAEYKKLPVEEVTKLIILEEVKKIPSRLLDEFKKDKV